MHLAKRIQRIPSSQTLIIESQAKELKAQGVDVISLTVGEPDFDTPAHIKDAAMKAIEAGFTKYTSAAGIPELRKVATEQINQELGLSYDWKQTVMTNGSKQGLYNFFQVAIETGDEVMVPSPYWLSFPPMIQLAGGIPKIIQTTQSENFKLTPKKLKNAFTKKTKAIVINSPSNPTGAVYSKEDLEALAPLLEKRPIWIVSDEAYYKILYDGLNFYSMAQVSKVLFEKTVIFRTCSKSYAMTGWRVGSVTGPKGVVDAIEILQSQSTSGVNAIAQKAALSALSEKQSEDGIRAMVKEFDRRRLLGLEALSTIPDIDFFRPQGAFYFFVNVSHYYGRPYKGNTIKDSSDMALFLLDKGKVAVIPGGVFGNDKYLRLSFATSLENIQKGIGRIKEALNMLE